MIELRKFLLAMILVILGATFSVASDIYVAQNAAGGNNGGDCADAHAVSWFNSSANWGSGNGQIGPGTTVHLCGTFNVSSGTAGITVLGSGTNANPITILMEPNAIIQSAYLGASDLFTSSCGPASACLAGIQVYARNYVVLDGGANGIIQNTANGTNLANHQASLGILVHAADHVIVRNFTIQAIYINAGSSPSASDTSGASTADIRVDGDSTNIAIYNNTLNSARIGISSSTSGNTGPANCPTPIGTVGVTSPASVPAPTGNWGICYYNNTLSDHPWQILTNGSGSVNVFSNEEGDIGSLPGWLNWQYPTSAYHQDGIFVWGGETHILTGYVYNNYSHGDLGQGSPSAHLYCAADDESGTNASGCALVAFNNVIVQTGSSQWPNDARNDQLIAVDLSSYSLSGPITLYNNTLVGGSYAVEIYTDGGTPQGGPAAFTFKNNIWKPGVPGSSTGWFEQETNGGTVMSSVTASNNIYFNGNTSGNGPWQINNTQYHTASTWAAACGCDAIPTLVSDPLLSSNFTLQSGSPGRGMGANLTNLGIAALNSDQHGVARPSSGAWDVGAFQFSTSAAPAPPTSLTAIVQ